MSNEFQYDVFLSHNAKDKLRVRRLAPLSQLSTINSQLSAGDCSLPDTFRRCKVADFREESGAAFAEVLATGQAETGAMKRRMGALPGQLFYSTQIPVCLWFLAKNKVADAKRGFRDQRKQTSAGLAKA